MEQLISALVDGVIVPVTSLIPVLVSNGVLFAVFAILWLGFGVGFIWSQGSLDAAWEWLRSLPLIIQAVVWLLLLPVTLGLWVWETTWPLVVRLVLVVGLAGWNLLMFLPRAATAAKP
jgi:hypothetical protein